MTDGVSTDVAWIGRRVARFRSDRRWTLAELAHRVGLSATQLSRIESGTRQPSVGTLIEIAAAFGVPLSELVDDQNAAPYNLTRLADRSARESAHGALSILSGSSAALQAVHIAIPARSEAPEKRHRGDEWLYVLTGRIEVGIGDDDLTLSAGDAIAFSATIAHRVANPEGRTAEILLVSAHRDRVM